MKAILEFDLDDPDDKREHDLCLAGKKLACAMSVLDENLRAQAKYQGNEQAAVFRKMLHDTLAEGGIILEDLL